MPYVQRSEAGEVLGQYANRQPGYAEEWIDEDASELHAVSLSQMAAAERAWRNSELLGVKWLPDGHIQFMGDCTHALAGQTVDIPNLD